jgi:hypothetical protein
MTRLAKAALIVSSLGARGLAGIADAYHEISDRRICLLGGRDLPVNVSDKGEGK